jgi:glycosyltransferase involved in cell wall biosynthesis
MAQAVMAALAIQPLPLAFCTLECPRMGSADIDSPGPSPLSLGLEVTTLAQQRRVGIGRYALALLHELGASEPAENLQIRTLCHLSQFRKRGYVEGEARHRLRFWRDFWLPPSRRLDLIHSTSWRLPAVSGPVKIVTIHDVFAALGINFPLPRKREKQMARLQRIAAFADRVICVSACSRRDFLQHFDFDPERADVVHLGVDAHFAPRRRPNARWCDGNSLVASPTCWRWGPIDPTRTSSA